MWQSTRYWEENCVATRTAGGRERKKRDNGELEEEEKEGGGGREEEEEEKGRQRGERDEWTQDGYRPCSRNYVALGETAPWVSPSKHSDREGGRREEGKEVWKSCSPQSSENREVLGKRSKEFSTFVPHQRNFTPHQRGEKLFNPLGPITTLSSKSSIRQCEFM